MLIRAPGGEAREVIENLFRVRVKDMRPVFVDEDPGRVVFIVSVSADVIAAVTKQNGFSQATAEPFREHASGETSADDEVIESSHYAASISRARLLASVWAMCSSSWRTMESHELRRTSARPRSIRSGSGRAAQCRALTMNSVWFRAIATTSLNCETTSSIAVDTIGLLVAMYSSAFVGLMKA